MIEKISFMLSHHIQRNMVMGNENPKSINKKCVTVHDKLNFLYCCPTQILWREKKITVLTR